MGELSVLFCRPGPGSIFESDFELEADVVDALAIETHIINADWVVGGDVERAVRALPEDLGPLLYRGPILLAEEYEELFETLDAHGAQLVTPPEAYELALYVPEYHPLIEDISPPTRWTHSEDVDEAYEAALELGEPPWLLKDHVKSVKEAWAQACFVPAGATREQFSRIAGALLELRGERFTRGFVIRKFLELVPSDASSPERRLPKEHRLFFWQSELIAHAPYHPVGEPLADTSPFQVLGSRIDSPFFSADIAFLAGDPDVPWTVIELNDGGASGFPDDLDPQQVYAAIAG